MSSPAQLNDLFKSVYSAADSLNYLTPAHTMHFLEQKMVDQLKQHQSYIKGLNAWLPITDEAPPIPLSEIRFAILEID